MDPLSYHSIMKTQLEWFRITVAYLITWNTIPHIMMIIISYHTRYLLLIAIIVLIHRH